MPRTRWLVLGVLSLLTASVILLDVSGVIFQTSPAPVPPPPLRFASVPPVAGPMIPIDPRARPTLTPQVERAVTRALADPALGQEVHTVVTAPDGSILMSEQPDTPVAPASSLKLLTAVSVLEVMAPGATLSTSVVEGDDAGALVLVGGGDATLSVMAPVRGDADTASLAELAKLTRKALSEAGINRVRLTYDASAFDAPWISPEWEPTYVTSGVVAPVTALMADQGLVKEDSLARYPNPALAAAQDFAAMLEKAGVDVQGDIAPGSAAGLGTPIAEVESPTISALVKRMLRDSDNQLAEALGRVAAAKSGLPASFDGAVEAMHTALKAHGVAFDPATVFDASGLSRQDRVPAKALVSTLQLASIDDQFRPIVEGLPIAGFDGTLVERFLVPPQSAAAGIVRAKTGTLTGVSTESGTAVTCDGDLVLYSFVADEISFDSEAARDALDRAAAALTRCG